MSVADAAVPGIDADKQDLLRVAREAAFAYGTWADWKRLYKAAEADPNTDPALLGALFARLDTSPITIIAPDPRVKLRRLNGVSGAIFHKGQLVIIGGQYRWNTDTIAVFAPVAHDPLQPRQLGSLSISSAGSGLSLCGSLVGFSTSDYRRGSHLHLVDVTEPTQLRLRGKIAFQESGFSAVENATFPYLPIVIGGDNRKFSGLRIYDLTDPDQPRITGELELKEANTSGVAVQGDLVAVTVGGTGFRWNSLPSAGGLRLIDISDPAHPRLIGSLNLNNTTGVAVRGNFAYVIQGGQNSNPATMQIVDISDPRHPRKAGFCTLTNDADKVIPVGQDSVYLLTRYQGTTIVDVRNPEAPVIADTITRLSQPSSISMDGDLAYVMTEYNGIAVFNVHDPLHPQRIGAPPSSKTIGYMKRRARRALWVLAKQDLDRYAAVATELLLGLTPPPNRDEKDKKKSEESIVLDGARHWATLDTLFGGEGRFRQTRHGRGRYIPNAKPPSRLGLRTREERVPEAWNAHPELLKRLLAQSNLPQEVYEFAVRVFRSQKWELPTIADALLTQWVQGTSPLLIALSVHAVTERMLKGTVPDPTLAADAWFRSGASVRQRLASERVGNWASKKGWAEAFATQLAALVRSAITADLQLSRRGLSGAALLARHFSWALAAKAGNVRGLSETFLPLVATFLQSGRTDLETLVGSGAEKAMPETLVSWLNELARVPAERAEATVAILEKTVRGIDLVPNTVFALANHTIASVRENGWRLLAASGTSNGTLNSLWNTLLGSVSESPALRTAMSSSYALGLLERAGIGPVELMAHVAERPFLVGLLSPEAFASVAETAPSSVVLSLVAASPDEQWVQLRPIWLQQLKDGIGREGVWLYAETALKNDNTDRLAGRLLGDAEIAETFLTVDKDEILGIRDPQFAALLGPWVQRYKDKFTQGSALLFEAATHPLPEVREPALEWVLEQGMRLPFALQLMESGVPPSITVGRTFFDNEPAGGEREADYALALCDSPVVVVRKIGQEYVTARWATLPHERVLASLFENPAPEIQAFVGALLNQEAERPVQTPLFDAEVLRAPNRARVAKEKVKARQTIEPTLDVATLLTLARSRTPRDAEWALSELARRALNGETIEGLTVEGLAGI